MLQPQSFGLCKCLYGWVGGGRGLVWAWPGALVQWLSIALCLVPTPTPGAHRAPPLFRIALLLSFSTLEPSQRPHTGMCDVPASSSPPEFQLPTVSRINHTPQTVFMLSVLRLNWVVFYCGGIKINEQFNASGSASDPYPGGIRFESLSRHWLLLTISWIFFFLVKFRKSRSSSNHFLPNSFQFVVHVMSHNSTLCRLSY
jgi:hypothetical protein